MDVNVSPSILKSGVMLVLWSVMRATWESTSYGCKCVTLNIKEWGSAGVVVSDEGHMGEYVLWM